MWSSLNRISTCNAIFKFSMLLTFLFYRLIYVTLLFDTIRRFMVSTKPNTNTSSGNQVHLCGRAAYAWYRYYYLHVKKCLKSYNTDLTPKVYYIFAADRGGVGSKFAWKFLFRTLCPIFESLDLFRITIKCVRAIIYWLNSTLSVLLFDSDARLPKPTQK